MEDIQEKIAEFDKILDEKMNGLLEEEKKVNAFIDSEHKAKATKEYRKKIHELASDINDFIILLVDTKNDATEAKDQIENLCKKGLPLNAIARDLANALTEDFKQKWKEEAINQASVVACMATVAGLAITLSACTFDKNSTYVITEAAMGASVGLGITCSKHVADTAKQAGKAICSAPYDLWNSPDVYYIRAHTKEFVGKLLNFPSCLKKGTLSAANDVSVFPKRGAAKKSVTEANKTKP